MRILYHHRTQAEDGQAVHIRALIQAFETAGHQVRELGLVQHGRESRPTRSGSARWEWVTRLPRFARELAEYGYNGLARRRIVGAAAHFEPDFVYERYAFANVSGVLAARKLRVPLVLEVNSPMVVELQRTRGLSFPGLARRLESFAFREADRVCVVSGVLRDMLLELGVDPARLIVTPNGVDLERYGSRDVVAARADLGLPERADGPILGFVGYYRAWHRLDMALEALARPDLRTARLVLIGEGPAEEELCRRAAELGVRERLHLAGPRPHTRIPALLAAFDVALLPAINAYASPLKLHEYMAARLAVVAPDQPNLREVVDSGENGVLVPPGDAQALGDALARLASDAALRERLGARARATIVERDLTWVGNARRVVDAVRALKEAA